MRHLHRTALMAACLTTALALGACNQPPASPAPPTAAVAAQTPVERGRVLVTAGGCHDCHTPKTFGPKGPQLDTDRLLSGHPEGGKIPEPYTPASGSPWTIATTDSLTAWSGPWGVSFAVNLTPDPNTGLRSGVWTEELVHQGDEDRQAHGEGARHPAAHAVADVRAVERRGSQGYLGVPRDRSADQQSRSGTDCPDTGDPEVEGPMRAARGPGEGRAGVRTPTGRHDTHRADER